ncbi:DUF1674 domain-containing protein [Rhizobium halophytocola]|uniref:DUF1674 domain-containing protein n=1 Tax=Rhizobium halophytocola TaxID=735519 RepID=A0ABS4E1Q8_9HYPH|nr:DUF1674 domain-containing protein [Rhizobium halophytocola]MBP1851867.1 hypothetical protein [Rhizobium halophytocola]
MSSNAQNDNAAPQAGVERPARPLPAAAKRALAEAEQRRQQQAQVEPPTEIGGRGGADPARYGDWEIKGRAIDF